ncbi:hypothetical protein NDU88_004552 [Pleurodeles waltl]|uniref:Uncharacterized protein n=1 Tax=Pleurodeles waltl TaxID=8319 RepID=A0AAV7TUH8_PLEWA|nr:hypothetical protein NDU88_004552 [Pleurodeles waltl]
MGAAPWPLGARQAAAPGQPAPDCSYRVSDTASIPGPVLTGPRSQPDRWLQTEGEPRLPAVFKRMPAPFGGAGLILGNGKQNQSVKLKGFQNF